MPTKEVKCNNNRNTQAIQKKLEKSKLYQMGQIKNKQQDDRLKSNHN